MLTIVWDIDDVLNDLMALWFHTAWLPAHPGCKTSYRELTENPPHRILGVERRDYLASLDAFRVSDAARRMTPNPEILEWLQCHGHRFRHIALTARPLPSVPHLSEWVFRHFGSFVRLFAFVPTRQHKGEPVYDTTKAEFLHWVGKGDVLIDDSSDNLAAARELGITGVLFPQPWNSCSLGVAEALQTLK